MDEPPSSSVRPVSRHSYLDPDLEAAINEVLSYKPVPFKRSSLEPDSDEDDRKSIRSARSAHLDPPERAASIRRSASAADVSRPTSYWKSLAPDRSDDEHDPLDNTSRPRYSYSNLSDGDNTEAKLTETSA
ncbi:hypothetical protein P7K49_011229 [Saguinus oedipus]|uniref:Uncharacterized protein n=1 Tax=Saguinus oedipus TaxID=9490 RepID=A0ABQ9VQ13_SAGOE|nr:hypothetical protein P7K49_011229 [Saguinus oedipus]